MLAVKQGRDDLAKQALVRQQEHAERASAVLDQHVAAPSRSETEKLKGSLRQLNDKIEEAKRKRNLLIAKQKRAQAQKPHSRDHVGPVGHLRVRGLQPHGRQDRRGGAPQRGPRRSQRGARGRHPRDPSSCAWNRGPTTRTWTTGWHALKAEMGLLPVRRRRGPESSSNRAGMPTRRPTVPRKTDRK